MAKPKTKVIRKERNTIAVEVSPVAAMQPDTDATAALAYQYWLSRGCPEGSPEIDWFRAEQELSGQSKTIQSSSTKQPHLTHLAGA